MLTSNNPATPDVSAVFLGNGTVRLSIDGDTTSLQAGSDQELRSEVVARAHKLAQNHNAPVRVRVIEGGSTTLVSVNPDGSNGIHNPEPAAPQQPTPAVPTAPPITAGARNNDAPTAPPTAPEEPVFEWADDPEWKQLAKEPADTGWRGVLKLPAGKAEIESRQQEFAQRMHDAEQRRQREEQQRREAAEQRRIQEQRDAEDLSRKQALLERRQAHKAKLNRTIQTNFQGTRTILVANPKGGARKTTTTYILGAMIGSTRGGSTIAWDANETMGTLGERARDDRHHRTVVDLLEDGAQHFLDIDSARVGILDAYVRNQGDCHFDVLASDENPSRQDQIDAEGFRKVHDILSHFYRMILVDTGNNIRADHFVEAQKHADQLVIPVAASHDSKNRALDMMAAFTAAGHDHLVANAVVLVHETELIERDDEGNPISNQSHELTAAEIASAFEGRVRTVLPVPYDPKLKDGGEIDYFQLSPDTITAYREAAASVSDALIDQTLQPSQHVNASETPTEP